MLTVLSLQDGPTVCIQRKPLPTSQPVILDSFFPKGIATAFSSKWSALFPQVNQIAIGSMHKAHPTTLTIVGGDVVSVKVVLNWMRSCCTGQGLQELLHIPRSDKPFYRYYLLKEAASIIGCTHLEKKLGDCMDTIANTQIHSEDVRALWLELPEGHEMRQYLALHIATLTWNRKLKAFRAYATLREELPNLDESINEILDPMAEERRRQRNAERNEYFQKQREERKKTNVQRKKEEKKVSFKIPAEKMTQLEDGKVESSLKLPVQGADDVSTVPYFKNKAAKRRQKKREEKAIRGSE